jgi:hypothetical protein
MRTTITLEDDAATVARDFAETHDVTLGKAVSILIRRAHAAQLRDIAYPDGFEPFPYRPDEPFITTEHVKRLQDELP